jgi:hypothetical protein
MIFSVRSLKSPLKRHELLDDILTSSYKVFKDFVSDMGVGIGKMGNPILKMSENLVVVK